MGFTKSKMSGQCEIREGQWCSVADKSDGQIACCQTITLVKLQKLVLVQSQLSATQKEKKNRNKKQRAHGKLRRSFKTSRQLGLWDNLSSSFDDKPCVNKEAMSPITPAARAHWLHRGHMKPSNPQNQLMETSNSSLLETPKKVIWQRRHHAA